jgi:aconitate hydratase
VCIGLVAPASNRTSQPNQPTEPPNRQGKRTDGSTYEFPVNHTFNEGQIAWFKAGSALNAMAAQFKK